MTMLEATLEGIGFWCDGLPSWDAARRYVLDGETPETAPTKPSPTLLAANERRRAPETVAVALEAALAACQAAGRDPATLPSVFTSTHGDLAITDYMCATLAQDPRTISPTRFHNSVHNAAAGYWTIGVGALQPATAISAFDTSFAQGLLETMTQLATGTEAALLVGYDSQSTGPLALVSPSHGLLGGALVLSRTPQAGAPRLQLRLEYDDNMEIPAGDGPLSQLAKGNAMCPMLPLFEALAMGQDELRLPAGPGQWLQIRIAHD